MIDRRTFLAAAGAAVAAGCYAQPPGNAGTAVVPPDFEPLRRRLGPGGRLGVAALDVASGRRLGHDEQSRYAMCSTFKLPLAAAILAEVEAGRLSLDEEIPFTRADLLPNSPATAANAGRGRLPVARLCAAIVQVSDNAGANVLLRRIGGPAGLTRFCRAAGDDVTRLDRYELELNSNLPADPRDTTSPAAMVGLMRALLLGDVLSPASRARLIGWAEGTTTGLTRLRAGLPSGWRVGDKTGTGSGANNDIAIAWPPSRGPILIASYTSGPVGDSAVRNGVHADVARLVAGALA